MQSEAVESGEWRVVVAVAGCKFGEKPFRHTHAHTDGSLKKKMDGFGTSGCIMCLC